MPATGVGAAGGGTSNVCPAVGGGVRTAAVGDTRTATGGSNMGTAAGQSDTRTAVGGEVRRTSEQEAGISGPNILKNINGKAKPAKSAKKLTKQKVGIPIVFQVLYILKPNQIVQSRSREGKYSACNHLFIALNELSADQSQNYPTEMETIETVETVGRQPNAEIQEVGSQSKCW